MISITFVEQPESASTRHHHTVNHARAAAALPSVIGGQPVYKVAASVPASEVWVAWYRSVYRKSARVLRERPSARVPPSRSRRDSPRSWRRPPPIGLEPKRVWVISVSATQYRHVRLPLLTFS